MSIINLREFYPWYTHNEFVEVSDEVAAELLADKRYEKTHERRMRHNKTYFFDEQTENEASVITNSTGNPEALFEAMEKHCGLCRALNSLPEVQGCRVEAHYLLGRSRKEIAESEGVSESAVNAAIEKGLANMKEFLKNYRGGGC